MARFIAVRGVWSRRQMATCAAVGIAAFMGLDAAVETMDNPEATL